MAAGVADDPAVGTRIGRLEREHAGRCARGAVLFDELLQEAGADAGMITGDDEQRPRLADALACAPERVAGSERTFLHCDLDSFERARRLGRENDDERIRTERPHRRHDPVDEPPPEQRMEVLWRRGLHPRAEAGRHHDGCEVGCHQNWGARLRTWDRGTKTRCLTTWLRPTTPSLPSVAAARPTPPDGGRAGEAATALTVGAASGASALGHAHYTVSTKCRSRAADAAGGRSAPQAAPQHLAKPHGYW